MTWLRFKYSILAFFDPRTWVRVGTYSKEWDTVLWNALVAGDIRFVGRGTADIAGFEVWIVNFPYASGELFSSKDKPTCSRATALFLNNELEAARIISNIKFDAESRYFYFATTKMRRSLS